MTDRDWDAGFSKAIGVFLNGDAITEPDPRGQRVVDDSFLMLFNAHSDPVAFTLPPARFGKSWEVVLDTAAGGITTEIPVLYASSRVRVVGHAAQIMRRIDAGEGAAAQRTRAATAMRRGTGSTFRY
jgi:isoamylase